MEEEKKEVLNEMDAAMSSYVEKYCKAATSRIHEEGF